MVFNYPDDRLQGLTESLSQTIRDAIEKASNAGSSFNLHQVHDLLLQVARSGIKEAEDNGFLEKEVAHPPQFDGAKVIGPGNWPNPEKDLVFNDAKYSFTKDQYKKHYSKLIKYEYAVAMVEKANTENGVGENTGSTYQQDDAIFIAWNDIKPMGTEVSTNASALKESYWNLVSYNKDKKVKAPSGALQVAELWMKEYFADDGDVEVTTRGLTKEQVMEAEAKKKEDDAAKDAADKEKEAKKSATKKKGARKSAAREEEEEEEEEEE